jgi:translation initiation factor 1A
MPKAKGSKKPKHSRQKSDTGTKAELLLREEGQEYAQAGRMLGNGRLEAICFDGKTRMAHIRGKLLKRVWISTGDVILVTLRDFQDGKADVVHKYNTDQVRQLKQKGEIPSGVKVSEVGFDEDADSDSVEFVFSEI